MIYNDIMPKYIHNGNTLDILTEKEVVVCVYSEKASSLCKVTIKGDKVSYENIPCKTIQNAKSIVDTIKPSPIVTNVARYSNNEFHITHGKESFLVKEELVDGQTKLTFNGALGNLIENQNGQKPTKEQDQKVELRDSVQAKPEVNQPVTNENVQNKELDTNKQEIENNAKVEQFKSVQQPQTVEPAQKENRQQEAPKEVPQKSTQSQKLEELMSEYLSKRKELLDKLAKETDFVKSAEIQVDLKVLEEKYKQDVELQKMREELDKSVNSFSEKSNKNKESKFDFSWLEQRKAEEKRNRELESGGEILM